MVHGVPVAGYFSRSYDSAAAAADFTETTAYQTLEELVSVSDTLFLTVPDGAIGRVWDCIRKTKVTGKIICHFSGSLSSHVFSEIGQTGASGCSLHPMYAFGGKFTSYTQFHTAIFTVEGEQRAVQKMTALFGGRLSHRILPIRAEDKMKYHAAASMASNYMIALFELSLQLLNDCGFSEEDGRALLRPLVQVNVDNMLAGGTQEALTGPIERNDVSTVEKHLGQLGSAELDKTYRILGQVLVSIAERKNQDRDYTALRHLLNNDEI